MLRALLGFMVAFAIGCGTPLDADLLTVVELTPEHIEPGTRVEITGSGFPAGRPAYLQLEGIMHRPGAAPREVEATIEGRAGSAEQISFVVDEALIEELGGRGTFEGLVTVRVAAEEGGVVSGRLHGLRLDVSPMVAAEVDVRVGHRREALALAEFIGIAPVLDDDAGTGFAVDGVRIGGPGDIAGISKSDRVLAIDGVRIATLDDFVPRPDSTRVTLEVQRQGERATVPVVIDIGGYSSPEPTEPWLLGAGLSGFLLLVLLFFSPLSAVTVRIAKMLPRRAQKSDLPWWRRVRPESSADVRFRDRLRIFILRAAALLGAAVALGVLPFTAHIYSGGVDVAILVLVSLAAWAASEAMRPRVRTKPGAVARAGAVASTIGHVGLGLIRVGAPTVLSVAAVVVLGGTLRSTGIVESQGGAIWDWYAFRHPVGFLAFPAFVTAGLVVPRLNDGRLSPVASVARHTSEFVLVGLGTVVFLGGWAVPGVAEDPLTGPPLLRLAAALTFLVKAGALSFGSRRLARGVAQSPWHLRLAALSAVAAAFGAAILMVFPPSPMLEVVSRPVLCGVAMVVAVHSLRRALRRRRPHLELHPLV